MRRWCDTCRHATDVHDENIKFKCLSEMDEYYDKEGDEHCRNHQVCDQPIIITGIGEIGNYYGGLKVKDDSGKYSWAIENWDGDSWQEIPKYLYEALMKFEEGS